MNLKNNYKKIFYDSEKKNAFIKLLENSDDPTLIEKFDELMTFFYIVHGAQLSEAFQQIEQNREQAKREKDVRKQLYYEMAKQVAIERENEMLNKYWKRESEHEENNLYEEIKKHIASGKR